MKLISYLNPDFEINDEIFYGSFFSYMQKISSINFTELFDNLGYKLLLTKFCIYSENF